MSDRKPFGGSCSVRVDIEMNVCPEVHTCSFVSKTSDTGDVLDAIPTDIAHAIAGVRLPRPWNILACVVSAFSDYCHYEPRLPGEEEALDKFVEAGRQYAELVFEFDKLGNGDSLPHGETEAANP